MGPIRPRAKFRVELGADHEGVVADLRDLNQAAVRRSAACHQAKRLKLLAVGVVELVAMAMALAHFLEAVGLLGLTAGRQAADVSAEAHGATLLVDAFLLRKQM